MEQHGSSDTAAHIPAVASPQNQNARPSASRRPLGPPINSHSVPSLRFPRPVGNQHLTNWVSSSSPDIMHPTNNFDEAASALDLGYEVINTDGESQAESTTSSSDYQRPDDIQSLADTDTGTDADTNEVDTDYSDEEEALVQHPAGPLHDIAEDGTGDGQDDDTLEAETLASQSLEIPTEVFVPERGEAFSPAASRPSTLRTLLLPARLGQEQAKSMVDGSMDKCASPLSDLGSRSTSRLSKSSTSYPGVSKSYHGRKFYNQVLDYFEQKRGRISLFIVLTNITVITLACVISLAGKYLWAGFHDSNKPLATVPVASVTSVLGTSPPAALTVSTSTVTSTITSTEVLRALQPVSSSKNLARLTPYDRRGTAKSQFSLTDSIASGPCSVELYGPLEIMVKIPRSIKSAWISREALLIAVSRGYEDIPTQLSSVDEGILLEVPHKEAYGILDVSIVTTRRPKINDTFHVDFGNHALVEAFDAGKELIKTLAQMFADTVNDSAGWMEETCVGPIDSVSKHVVERMTVGTAAISDSVYRGIQEVGNVALGLPALLRAQLDVQSRRSFGKDAVSDFANRLQTELMREAQDLGDEVSLTILTAQLHSRLWWLKLRGKEAEYQHYLEAADGYYKQKRAEAAAAKGERAQRVKQETTAQGKRGPRRARNARRNEQGSGSGGS